MASGPDASHPDQWAEAMQSSVQHPLRGKEGAQGVPSGSIPHRLMRLGPEHEIAERDAHPSHLLFPASSAPASSERTNRNQMNMLSSQGLDEKTLQERALYPHAPAVPLSHEVGSSHQGANGGTALTAFSQAQANLFSNLLNSGGGSFSNVPSPMSSSSHAASASQSSPMPHAALLNLLSSGHPQQSLGPHSDKHLAEMVARMPPDQLAALAGSFDLSGPSHAHPLLAASPSQPGSAGPAAAANGLGGASAASSAPGTDSALSGPAAAGLAGSNGLGVGAASGEGMAQSNSFYSSAVQLSVVMGSLQKEMLVARSYLEQQQRHMDWLHAEMLKLRDMYLHLHTYVEAVLRMRAGTGPPGPAPPSGLGSHPSGAGGSFAGLGVPALAIPSAVSANLHAASRKSVPGPDRKAVGGGSSGKRRATLAGQAQGGASSQAAQGQAASAFAVPGGSAASTATSAAAGSFGHPLDKAAESSKAQGAQGAVGKNMYPFPVTRDKDKVCATCHTHDTPRWRRGPDGQRVCNACGLLYLSRKRKSEKALSPVPGMAAGGAGSSVGTPPLSSSAVMSPVAEAEGGPGGLGALGPSGSPSNSPVRSNAEASGSNSTVSGYSSDMSSAVSSNGAAVLKKVRGGQGAGLPDAFELLPFRDPVTTVPALPLPSAGLAHGDGGRARPLGKADREDAAAHVDKKARLDEGP